MQVTDPTGQLWTVLLVRPGEPHSPWMRLSNTYGLAVAKNRLGRLLRRDQSWDVELMPGDVTPDRRGATVRVTATSKTAATEAAVRLAQEVQRGDG